MRARVRTIVLWGALGISAFLTVSHRGAWRDNATLWLASVSEVPTSPRATFNLGTAALEEQRFQTACYWFARTRDNVQDAQDAYIREAVLGLVAHNETWITAFTDTSCD